jgi:hypothetical protein
MPDLLESVMKLTKLTAKTVKKANKAIKKTMSKNNSKIESEAIHSTTQADTDVLPITWPLKKKKAPWYLQWTHGDERFSLTEDGALRVELVKGCYGLKSGAAFRANPHMMLPADAATLSYSVYFPPDFDFVKGGKLPGVNIGCNPMDCSTGGGWSDTGGSFRIMFREHGAAIGYMYMPLPGAGPGAFEAQNAEYKAVGKVKSTAGIDLWHGKNGGDLQLKPGSWNTVSISVRLNTPGHSNGAVAVTVNGRTRSLDGILWRLNDNSKINAVNFVTFFGGGSDDWSSPVDTFVCYKDIAFAAN